jgi:uncharacterized membrane protein YheB (UPF0754 family)
MAFSWTYLLIPLVCGLIGWMTNAIAVRMIFRPRRPISVLGFKVQGLIPRRQSDLALSIGETIESKLLTHEDIQAALSSPEIQADLEKVIREQVEQFLDEKLGSNPLLAGFLQGEMAENIKNMLSQQLKSGLLGFMDGMLETIENRLDLKAIVQQRIESFDMATLETIILAIASRELKTIEILGGVLGFLVGIAQVAILVLAG